MKRSVFLMLFFIAVSCAAQELKPIKLNAPDLKRTVTLMNAFSNRKSTRTFSDKMLSHQDLSDLLWAANGINRPKEGKRTAPSARNKQDIKVYVCMAEGNYLYNASTSTLDPISKDDVRPMKAPVCLVLVSDSNESWGALDAGIVSQNISLFCSGADLATVCRASMNKEELKKALNLTDKQTLYLNHPVGYFK